LSKKEGSNIFKIVKMIMERNFAPVIVFSFSKKECEAYALQMARLDFNTNEEKKLVDEVFNNAMMVLSKEDRTLPQVENVLPLLKRGIGIHHGGLLPILKATDPDPPITNLLAPVIRIFCHCFLLGYVYLHPRY
jgi:ATP-dependent RNA helicase DOB1